VHIDNNSTLQPVQRLQRSKRPTMSLRKAAAPRQANHSPIKLARDDRFFGVEDQRLLVVLVTE
jgi:hypothetical protein